MGLIDFIKQNLPEPWEKAATELKMKTDLIYRLHANVPRAYKNKYHYKEGIRYIRYVFKQTCEVKYLVEATNIDHKKWDKLDEKIKYYRHLCD